MAGISVEDQLNKLCVCVCVCVCVCACVCVHMRVYVCVLSCIWLFVAPWTVAHQAPLSVRFSRQEYWNGLLLHSTPEDPLQGIFQTQG